MARSGFESDISLPLPSLPVPYFDPRAPMEMRMLRRYCGATIISRVRWVSLPLFKVLSDVTGDGKFQLYYQVFSAS